MASVLHDLRQGLRMFTKASGLALACVAMLGLGVGAATAIFAARGTA